MGYRTTRLTRHEPDRTSPVTGLADCGPTRLLPLAFGKAGARAACRLCKRWRYYMVELPTAMASARVSSATRTTPGSKSTYSVQSGLPTERTPVE